MTSTEESEGFYRNLISILLTGNVPFMIGGTYALRAYTGIVRPTKDMDVITTFDDYPKILKVLSDAGYKTEILEQNWIAKVFKDNHFVDIVFAEKNGLEKVDSTWLARSGIGEVLGIRVKLVPVDALIRSKAYIQYRERFDGSDVLNLILRQGKTLDWKLLKEKMEPNWEILFAHIINFLFVYPNDISVIPKWLIEEYSKRLTKVFDKTALPGSKVTRGLLISSQYEVAVKKWGYKPITPFFNNLYEQRDQD